MIYGYIHFLGDSLTNGARDAVGWSFPMEACRVLSERMNQGWVPLIDAESGIASAHLARLAPRLMLNTPAKEVVVLIGTNDARDDIEPAMFGRHIECIIRAASAANKRLYVCTIPLPCGFGSAGYTRAVVPRIREYNALIEKRLEGDSIDKRVLVRLSSVVGGTDCFADGIHFSAEGNKRAGAVIAEAILEARTFK